MMKTTQKTKRWRVSDIVRAAQGAKAGSSVAAFFVYDKVVGLPEEVSLRRVLRVHWRIMALTCGSSGVTWQLMTHEQRCNALVLTAKRLGVPRCA